LCIAIANFFRFASQWTVGKQNWVLSRRVQWFSDRAAMERLHQYRYKIPAGTRVEIQNLSTGDRGRPHVTRKELRFAERTNTGYGGSIFYFTFREWVIAVNANDVK